MAPIEPGTYRIVNVLSKTAISIPTHDPWAIIGWEIHGWPAQQWFVRRSGEGYHIQSCANGRYITVDSTEWSARAYLGQYPPTWQFLPDREGTYVIQYGDSDRVLDMHEMVDISVGHEIHIWPRHGFKRQRLWKFERLEDSTGDQDERTQTAIEIKNEPIAGKNQQLREKDRLITQQAGQLAQKDQQLVEQSRELVELGGRLVEQSRELAAKNEKREEDQSEVTALREKVERLERLMAQMMDGDVRKPNNIP